MKKNLTIKDKEKVLELIQNNAFNYFFYPLDNELLQDKDVVFTTLKKDLVLFEKVPDNFFSNLNCKEVINLLEILIDFSSKNSGSIVFRYDNPLFKLCKQLLLSPVFLNFVNKKYLNQNISSYSFHAENKNFIDEAIAFLNHQIMKEQVIYTDSKPVKITKF